MAKRVLTFKLQAMETIIVELKRTDKQDFLLALLAELDFVRVVPAADLPEIQETKTESKHSFFSSAGLWAGRNVDADTLRAAAWKR